MLPVKAKNQNFMQQMDKDDLRVLAVRYFQEEVVGRSHHTLDVRKKDLSKFFKFYESLNGHLSVKSLMPRDVKLFMGDLHAKDYAPNSINRALGSVRAFGTWLVENGIVRLHPCKGIRELQVSLGNPKAPRDREYHRLLKTAQALADSQKTSLSQNMRDLILIETLNGSGLRISELLSLKLDQYKGKRFRSVYCKGGKVRDVSLKTRVCELLDEYINHHRVSGTDYLFTSKSGQPLDRVSVWKVMQKIARITSASFPSEPVKLTPHMLRHRHAYKTREARDPVFAAHRLGHSNLNYIQRYAGESVEEEQSIIENID